MLTADLAVPAFKRGAQKRPLHSAIDPGRAEAVRRIAEIGATAWKVETGTHRRSRAETALACFKSIIGPSLRSRNRDTQITGAAIAVRSINTLTAPGMPISAEIK